MNKGQSVIEYLLIFAIIAVLTLLSLSALYPRLHQAGEDAFDQTVGEILQ